LNPLHTFGFTDTRLLFLQFKITHGGKEHPCAIVVTVKDLKYIYQVTVDKNSLAKHSELIRKIHRTWTVTLDNVDHIVVLEKDKLAVCVDGETVSTEDEFVDDGTDNTFKIGPHDCCIHTRTIGENVEQILYVGEEEIPEKFGNRLVI
jgi:hypothetical protein